MAQQRQRTKWETERNLQKYTALCVSRMVSVQKSENKKKKRHSQKTTPLLSFHVRTPLVYITFLAKQNTNKSIRRCFVLRLTLRLWF